jgi:heat shock protein HslJ
MTRHFPVIAFLLPAAFLAVLSVPRAGAAPATAIYRGEAPGASGPARRVELQLRTDGTMIWSMDYRNNMAPVIEEGRWNPVSTEEIEIVFARGGTDASIPGSLRLLKQGDTLRATPGTAPESGIQGLQLKLVKAATPAAAPLPSAGTAAAGGLWRWESLVSAHEKIAVNQPERYTLDLQPGGKATVVSDCNRGTASYRIEGRSLSIKLAAMTRANCASGSLSAAYLRSLEGVASQRVRGDQLFLDLPGDGGTLTFARAK